MQVALMQVITKGGEVYVNAAELAAFLREIDDDERVRLKDVASVIEEIGRPDCSDGRIHL